MKGGVVTLYERILTEYKRVDKQIIAIKQDLSGLPEGKLICCHHGTRCKWYQSDGHKKIYIPKSNFPLAMRLARQKYLTLKLKDLENEIVESANDMLKIDKKMQHISDVLNKVKE